MNSGSDGGKLVLNGNAVAAGAWVNRHRFATLPAELCRRDEARVSDSVSIKAYDGHVWSARPPRRSRRPAAPTPPKPAAPTPPAADGVLGELSDPGIEADVAKLMVGNSLSYNSMLTILQDAAVGGMTSGKFSTLQTLASLLNASGGISTSTYVQDITKSVVDGDPANATWTGGSSTPVALGNLSATSSQASVNELIGEWFLGTDLPNIDVSSIGETNLGSTYQATTNPLYGSSGTPSYLDVNQGYLGDCYFLSSLAEVALQDPNAIESMITNNGNGTYGVRFDVNGQDEYVTVNNQLPTMPSGYYYANGSKLEFANGSVAWPELIEKAYAELNEEPNAPHGANLNSASNSYAGISGGGGYALTEITGQSVNSYALSSIPPPRRSHRTIHSSARPSAAGRNCSSEPPNNVHRPPRLRPHVRSHRLQCVDRHADPAKSLGLRLFGLAGDDVHRIALLARRQQQLDLRDDRLADGLTGGRAGQAAPTELLRFSHIFTEFAKCRGDPANRDCAD